MVSWLESDENVTTGVWVNVNIARFYAVTKLAVSHHRVLCFLHGIINVFCVSYIPPIISADIMGNLAG